MHPTGYMVGIVVIASLVLMLVRPRGIAEVWWVGGGATVLVALRMIPFTLAAHAVQEGTDVYLFLLGMMLISELAREHGVFDWLAATAVRNARGSGSRLFSLVYGAGTLVTIFMSNDATAVVLTPAILLAVRKAKVAPLPYLFVCALVANAASFVLPVSNPANLVVFQTGIPPLGRWLASFALPSVLSVVATYFAMRLVFRADLSGGMEMQVEEVPLTADGKLVLGGLAAVTALLLTVSALGDRLGLPTCVAAVILTATVSIKAKSNPLQLAKEISWSTLILVAALFVLVDAVEQQGALHVTRAWLESAERLGPVVGSLLLGFVVGIGNNLVNNLPLGLIAGATLQAAHARAWAANAVLIGVDLGPNLSITGSLATILWLLALRRQNVDVGFWKFLRVGAVAMPVAMGAALLGSAAMRWLSGQ